MARKLFGKPELSWLAAAVVGSVLLAGALVVPLWKMQLVAPQYPKGLVMYAYGYKFEGSGKSTYDDIREINGLNHYIGMKKIKPVNEMKIFVPSVVALIAASLAVSVVAWKRRWLQALMILGFWTMPVFFVADLQFWLYHYGHTMNPEAPLNTGSFTPKVLGTTRVWNFHSETGFELGFYLMVAAALVVTVVPLGARLLQSRRGHRIAPKSVPSPLETRAGRTTA